ncbi:MAG TPA: hypothetical protein VGW39_07235 [Chthoniobacterales bacterium]|nr:hypothetical protein [Chthoniobacterales bacterium]
MASSTEKFHYVRWIITILISLVAAGGGLVALLKYFHRPPEVPEPLGTPIVISLSLSPKKFKGPGGTTIVTITAKSSYGRPIRNGEVIVKAKCSFYKGLPLFAGARSSAGSGTFQPPGESTDEGTTRLVGKTNDEGIFTARWLYPEIGKKELDDGIRVLDCRFSAAVSKVGYSGATKSMKLLLDP